MMENGRVKTVAIIPAYNEESSIAKVILRTKPYVDKVVVCDDGSKDMTPWIAKALGAIVISHPAKRGKGEALKTLFKEVMKFNPEVIIALDGDGQHDPDQIPMIIKPIEAGECDVVVGSRYVYGSEMDAPLYRRVGLRVINLLYKKVSGSNIKDSQCGFRAYSPKAFEFLINCNEKGYGIEGEQVVGASRNGLRLMEVPISVKYNGLAKTSKKSPVFHGADLILTLFRLLIEEKPLKYLGLPGMGLMSIGTILGLYLLWTFNITRCFSISAALLALGTTVGGLLLAVAAIIVDRLRRMNEKLNHKRFER
jgi:glycosyltransferase involved in cell wall biosynthesis